MRKVFTYLLAIIAFVALPSFANATTQSKLLQLRRDTMGQAIGGNTSRYFDQIEAYLNFPTCTDVTGQHLNFDGSVFSCGNSGGSSPSGSQYQIGTFTGINALSGNANLTTDATNDLLIPNGHVTIGTGLGTGGGFTLNIRDPNGDLNFGVPTFRSATINKNTAFDVEPNGSASDGGWGVAWEDVCNSDNTNGGGGISTSCVHLGAHADGSVTLGENQYGAASSGVVKIVDGPGNGGGATVVATFGSTSGLSVLSGLFISSTGGSVPTCACTGGTPTCVTATGSTNNRGQIQLTGGTGVTTCTLTFNASAAPPQAPFCIFGDGNASTSPKAYSAGAASTTTAVVDFASATAANINYQCE